MRPQILTVDDARTVRLIAERALAAYDCDVNEATNGFNALFAMEKVLPDLVLLDVSMPVMGGLELLTMMRSNPALRKIPVLMLTSPADHAVRPQIEELGVSGILMKPFNEVTLVEKIRGVISLNLRKTKLG
ncbi:MAG: response regulator [Candidatus Didemnitutus sp.]|nr:response regulator [Candidatus Didemnitutus sp.]